MDSTLTEAKDIVFIFIANYQLNIFMASLQSYRYLTPSPFPSLSPYRCHYLLELRILFYVQFEALLVLLICLKCTMEV